MPPIKSSCLHQSAPILNRQTDPTLFPEYPGLPNHSLYTKFDPIAQRISTTGVHAWAPPGPNDIRGPCPGLNAAANHGYISRSGVIGRNDVFNGLKAAFNFDAGPAAVFYALAVLFDGDPLTGRFSICAYGHNHIEADASMTRGDWLAPSQNSNCASYPEFGQQLLDLALLRNGPSGNITPRVLAEHALNRRQHSISTNPNYFSAPFAGLFINFGAHMLAYTILANHLAEHPRGYLSPESFMSLWSYSRDADGNLTYTYGHERIPDIYYKAAADDQWTVQDFLVSSAQRCLAWPESCQVGGNTGTVNSFAGVTLGDISGGLVNAVEDFQDPVKLGCFLAQAVKAETPGFLSNVFSVQTVSLYYADLAKI
ncbi:putative Aromatic peroxygenase [Glarea lozoyensis 74030]|uniref:Putative Aromatic peroxygenase n=1 Tax=Glarea lozoyensis (strain ATCC 74030 / MF5533) TaxID=1104152 RepID=H0ETA8_GLAL7|nr:putative Aromatic peroxygenase [Glarea lozoyensis 74030]